MSLVDTAFVGRLGTEALAALGVNAAIFTFAFMLFNFLAYGTTPLVASAVGKKQREEAGRLVSAALALSVVLGIAATAVLWAGAGPIARVMGAEGSLLTSTLEYLQIRLWATPAVLLITAGHGAFRGYGDTKTPLYLALALNVVNLVLDPILIFGLGLGISGAAWATVIAQWAGAAGFVILLLGTRREALGIPLQAPRMSDMRRLAGVGSILSVRTFALVFAMTAATAVATRMGERIVAAHLVASQLWLLFALLIDAFALAGQSLVAEHLGAGNPGTARAISDRLLQWGVGLGAGLAAGVWVAEPMWILLFDLDAPVAAEFIAVLPIVALMQPLNAVVFVWDGVFMGAERFAYLAGSTVFAAAGALVGLAVVWDMEAGLIGIWVCMAILIGARGLTQAVRYYGPATILPLAP